MCEKYLFIDVDPHWNLKWDDKPLKSLFLHKSDYPCDELWHGAKLAFKLSSDWSRQKNEYRCRATKV